MFQNRILGKNEKLYVGHQEQRWDDRERRDDKHCLEQMKFEVLAGPLSGQKWGLETGCGETETGGESKARSRTCLKGREKYCRVSR